MEYIQKHKKIVVLFILFVVGLAIYGNSFNNEFFWDDDDSIVNNVYIKDWRYLPKFFTENLIAGAGQTTNYWRPVLLMSFALDYQIWGLESFGFHLTNALLHILAAWLIFLILYKLFRLKKGRADFKISDFNSFWLPFLVSLFFLIHPLQTEAVTYVAGRADSLSTVFSLLAILFYIYYRKQYEFKQIGTNLTNVLVKIWKKNWRLLLSLLFFVLGLLTKEQVILLPALILLVELIFITKKINRQSILNIIKLLSLFFLISLIYFILRLTLLDFNDILHGFEYGEFYDSSVSNRLFTFCLVMIFYFKLLFIPVGLHMAREVPLVSSFFSWPVLLFVAILILIIILSVKTWKKNRFITFGFLWFFIILLPRTNIFQINRPMYEHWLYLPMVGFWLAFFSLIIFFFNKIKLNRKAKMGVFIFLCFYIFMFSALTISRNNDWQNPIIFYEKNLKYTPDSFIQHNNLGMAYAGAGRVSQAITEYKKAIEIKDVYAQVHYNLANSLRDTGDLDEAINEYNIAIKMSPSFSLPYNSLLAIYLSAGNAEQVDDILKRMKVVFNKSDYLYLAGAAYYNLGEYEKSLSNWRELLEIDPSNMTVRELVKDTKNKIK